MDKQVERLITDNPNLCSSALSRLTGVNVRTLNRKRNSSAWRYKGVGVPFLCFVNSKDAAFYEVRCKREYISRGAFEDLIENVDRLIYALDNGGLPPTRKESYFIGLGFIK